MEKNKNRKVVGNGEKVITENPVVIEKIVEPWENPNSPKVVVKNADIYRKFLVVGVKNNKELLEKVVGEWRTLKATHNTQDKKLDIHKLASNISLCMGQLKTGKGQWGTSKMFSMDKTFDGLKIILTQPTPAPTITEPVKEAVQAF